MRRNEGITLIALIITIVIMLILVAVSTRVLIKSNLIGKAEITSFSQRGGMVEDIVNVWRSNKKINNYIEENISETREEVVKKLENQNLITPEEKKEIEEKGHVKIGVKNIIFSNGLDDLKYMITKGDEEVIFKNVILEGDIIAEKPDYQSYEIKGISNSVEGECITTGSLNGKTGTLEIVGDVKNGTFKYKLNDFMHGNEEFFVKVEIDNKEYVKKLIVIQGDCITYEESFIGFKLETDEKWLDWTLEEDERYSGGKALVCTVTDTSKGTKGINWNFYGRGIEILSKDSASAPARILAILRNPDGKGGVANIITLDCEQGEVYQSDVFEKKKWTDFEKLTKNLNANDLLSLAFYGSMPPNMGLTESKVVFDAVKIYK